MYKRYRGFQSVASKMCICIAIPHALYMYLAAIAYCSDLVDCLQIYPQVSLLTLCSVAHSLRVSIYIIKCTWSRQ